MRCPNCGQENADTSAFCFECGTRLKSDTPTGSRPAAPAAPPDQAPAAPPSGPASSPAPPAPGPGTGSAPPEVLRPGFPDSAGTVLTHLGQVFGLGYGPDYYAVWDLRKAGEPVARFDTSPIGWEAAWRRFHELERVHGIPAWRRPVIGWIVLHVAIGLVALGFVQVFLIGFVLGVAGRDVDDLSDATGWGLATCVLTGLVAWLLFVFLRKPPGVRWTVFLGLLAAGFVVALSLAVATQPPTL
jgi:hypothetical protein